MKSYWKFLIKEVRESKIEKLLEIFKKGGEINEKLLEILFKEVREKERFKIYWKFLIKEVKKWCFKIEKFIN